MHRSGTNFTIIIATIIRNKMIRVKQNIKPQVAPTARRAALMVIVTMQIIIVQYGNAMSKIVESVCLSEVRFIPCSFSLVLNLVILYRTCAKIVKYPSILEVINFDAKFIIERIL